MSRSICGNKTRPLSSSDVLGRMQPAHILVKELRRLRSIAINWSYTTEYPTSETVILLVEGEDRRYLHSFGANRAFKVSDINRDWVAALHLLLSRRTFCHAGNCCG